jgi:hypothetical protein
MKIFTTLVILLMLVSCATSSSTSAKEIDAFIKYYEQYYDGILPITEEVKVFILDSENDVVLDQLATSGYQIIGESNWFGPATTVTEEAKNYAKNIGAEAIVYYSEFLQSNPSSFTLSTGQTIYRENKRYTHNAGYLVKKNINKMKHGLYFNMLSSDEKELYQTSYGFRISTVINNYPAFNAGFIPGDIILEVDGIKMIELEDYPPVNKDVSIFKVLRAGSVKEIRIDNANSIFNN